MKFSLEKLAEKKWFLPLTLFLMLLIVLSSLSGRSSEAVQNTVQTENRTVEEQVEALCNSVRGVSNAKVMISYASVGAAAGFGQSSAGTQEILAVALVCDGGSDPNVRLALYELLGTLFQIPSTRISISGRG